MSDVAVQVDGLSKRYVLGQQQERYQSFQETFIRNV